MVMIAMAFLQHLRLAEHRRTGRGKNAPPRSRTTTIAKPARGARRPRRAPAETTASANTMSALQL
jgi:hypothetical protein